MSIEEVREIRSLLLVLRGLGGQGGFATVPQLCNDAGLSRSAVDKSLRILVGSGLVRPGRKRFGRPRILSLTDQGIRAAKHLRSLDLLLSGKVS